MSSSPIIVAVRQTVNASTLVAGPGLEFNAADVDEMASDAAYVDADVVTRKPVSLRHLLNTSQ